MWVIELLFVHFNVFHFDCPQFGFCLFVFVVGGGGGFKKIIVICCCLCSFGVLKMYFKLYLP